MTCFILWDDMATPVIIVAQLNCLPTFSSHLHALSCPCLSTIMNGFRMTRTSIQLGMYLPVPLLPTLLPLINLLAVFDSYMISPNWWSTQENHLRVPGLAGHNALARALRNNDALVTMKRAAPLEDQGGLLLVASRMFFHLTPIQRQEALVALITLYPWVTILSFLWRTWTTNL